MCGPISLLLDVQFRTGRWQQNFPCSVAVSKLNIILSTVFAVSDPDVVHLCFDKVSWRSLDSPTTLDFRIIGVGIVGTSDTLMDSRSQHNRTSTGIQFIGRVETHRLDITVGDVNNEKRRVCRENSGGGVGIAVLPDQWGGGGRAVMDFEVIVRAPRIISA